jgi:hypothetical protein
MVDTFPPVDQVDGGDLALTVPDGEAAIIRRGPYRHRQPRQPATDEPAPAPEADGALLTHLAHQILRPIDDGRQRLGEDARTGGIAAGGDRIGEGFMRPLAVVGLAPGLEAGLGTGQIREGSGANRFRPQGAVQPLDFALRLGMPGAAMPGLDAQAQQPRLQRRDSAHAAAAPGRAIVGQDDVGQAIAAEGGRQVRLDQLVALMGTGRHRQGKAGMVVEDGQGVDATGGQLGLAHEVHLPQVVGCRVFKALIGMDRALLWGQPPMPAQDGRDRARGRDVLHHALRA